ncbi:hypothetical protein CJ030_MR5G003564 [Morella rubra]|uniref:Uncharacterized protein n=1 Tax=Morella rubra TaxID=262757 RepID=A0A6A1VN77_9ROSI|nr:hypothetical protein CJ030_MR5G003564 [Morella rubra]
MNKRLRTSSQADAKESSVQVYHWMSIQQSSCPARSLSSGISSWWISMSFGLRIDASRDSGASRLASVPLEDRVCVKEPGPEDDAQISLPYGVLLTQFLHNLMVPEGADEPRALPLGSINKTMLSKSMAQTRRVLGAARAARARREEPAQGTEEQDLGQGSSQGLEGQRPSWVVSMMTELTEQMRAVMQPTHEMVGNISSRLAALELKVVSMDAELKKQVSEVQLALKSIATSAELVALTERVVLLEEHMSDVRAVLHLSDD